MFEIVEDIKFIRQEINPYFFTEIINECDVVARASNRRYWRGSPHIYAHKL